MSTSRREWLFSLVIAIICIGLGFVDLANIPRAPSGREGAMADFLDKLAHGHADDLLSTLCLARDCPLLVAPAMNVEMWRNPATQRNVAQLRADGVAIFGPASGELACNETGDGRMLEPEEIFAALVALRQPKLLAGKRVLVTAGPTFEPIDPVRGITNSSSGKMGFAVAQAAAEAGAAVTLVAGPSSLATPAGTTRIDVRSAREMADAVLARVHDADVIAPAGPRDEILPVEGDALVQGPVDGLPRAGFVEIGAAGQPADWGGNLTLDQDIDGCGELFDTLAVACQLRAQPAHGHISRALRTAVGHDGDRIPP